MFTHPCSYAHPLLTVIVCFETSFRFTFDMSSEFYFYLTAELTWQKMRKPVLYLMRVSSLIWFEFQVNVTKDEEVEVEIYASSEFFFIRVLSSCDRRWRSCLDLMGVPSSVRFEFRVHETEKKKLSWTWCEFRVPLLLEFWVNLTQDEKFDAILNASSKFYFD